MEKLKKDSLSLIETVALSAAVMAPSVSMALNVSLITGLAGYSVTPTFDFESAIPCHAWHLIFSRSLQPSFDCPMTP